MTTRFFGYIGTGVSGEESSFLLSSHASMASCCQRMCLPTLIAGGSSPLWRQSFTVARLTSHNVAMSTLLISWGRRSGKLCPVFGFAEFSILQGFNVEQLGKGNIKPPRYANLSSCAELPKSPLRAAQHRHAVTRKTGHLLERPADVLSPPLELGEGNHLQSGVKGSAIDPLGQASAIANPIVKRSSKDPLKRVMIQAMTKADKA